jgi:hypothetical protein
MALPVWFSPLIGTHQVKSSATVVFAGHVVGSDRYCDCGSPNCVCGPGETRVQSDQTVLDIPVSSQDTPADFGTESLLVLAAVLLWLRLRT